jgi:hypothetical protein
MVFAFAVVTPTFFLIWKSCSSDWLTGVMTAYLACLTGYVIYWQGQTLKKQLELQVVTELFKEWNSQEMQTVRKSFDRDATTDEALNQTETILEYLERIASYYKNHVLSRDLIWDTIGWYLMRYYHYNVANIGKIRDKWNDPTLYSDLEALYPKLVEIEITKRKHQYLTSKAFEKELDDHYQKFIQSER